MWGMGVSRHTQRNVITSSTERGIPTESACGCMGYTPVHMRARAQPAARPDVGRLGHVAVPSAPHLPSPHGPTSALNTILAGLDWRGQNTELVGLVYGYFVGQPPGSRHPGVTCTPYPLAHRIDHHHHRHHHHRPPAIKVRHRFSSSFFFFFLCSTLFLDRAFVILNLVGDRCA